METLERRPEFAYTTGYGYGWYLDAYKGHNVIHHGGSNPGYRSSLHLFPDDDLVVATLANIMVTDIPTNLAWYIADGILGLPKTEDWIYEFTAKRTQRTYDSYARIFKNDIPDRIKNTHHVHKLPAYAGEYTHPVYGKITVTLQEDDALYMQMRIFESKLEHYHYETFHGIVHDFMVNANLLLTFRSNRKGAVDALETLIFMEGVVVVFEKTKASKTETKEE
ncbi:hypothetical protein BGX23_003711 [Mortierella sp. AD031]|nr:hypothetical protein BGX23_003711 [Mortierella sp. AD031]